MFNRAQTVIRLSCLAALALVLATADAQDLKLQASDVIAFLGGSDVVAAQEHGHLESLLRVAHPQVRIRSLAWEADTVFAQPRDFKFPDITNQLASARATIVLCQFGQGESFGGAARLEDFVTAYRRLIRRIGTGRKVALITPHPFERGDAPIPDISKRNADLNRYVEAIRKLAREETAHLIDVHAQLVPNAPSFPLTDDGWHLTPQGHAFVAQRIAESLGLESAGQSAGAADAHGRWANPKFEQLRAVVIEKNRLWFNYSRPMNWAFLGGDRVEQPSSRDHINPGIRWFPAEMEKYIPLIEQRESEIENIAKGARR